MPTTSTVDSPLDIQTIHESQQDDTELLACKEKHSELYFVQKVGAFKIICHANDRKNRNTKWQIALPKKMVKSTLKWFYIVMRHPGSKKLRLTLEQRYYQPAIRRYIDAYKCADCQHHKLDGKRYWLFPQ